VAEPGVARAQGETEETPMPCRAGAERLIALPGSRPCDAVPAFVDAVEGRTRTLT